MSERQDQQRDIPQRSRPGRGRGCGINERGGTKHGVRWEPGDDPRASKTDREKGFGPQENWATLKKLMDGQYTYSMQQGLENLNTYMDWINSCRLLVTNDSLGLHIALALRKKVVVLYGPTNPHETYFYDRGEILYPDVDYPCIPCLAPTCTQPRLCMEFIEPAAVKQRIDRLLAGRSGT